MSAADSSRHRLLELLRRHGWNSTSFQAVETEFRYWFDPEGDAAVAYLDTGQAWVVAGSPIAALERCAEVAERFRCQAAKEQRRVVFFATEPRFLRAAPMRSLLIGEQPSWNPRSWVENHRGHRGLREQLRRARAKGVSVARIPSNEAAGPMRPELDWLISRWLASRRMPAMSFLVALEPFVFPEERRYYAARWSGRVIGLLVAIPIYDRGGWFFENILRDPSSPQGTTELMIDAAMLDVAADECTFVTLGLAPLAAPVPWHRIVRKLLEGFYNFEGLRAFKAKLRPDSWTPIFVAWPDERSRAAILYDVLSAFAGGRLGDFVLHAILRAPSPVVFALSAILVPWTVTLALADADRWFGSRRVQFAWIAFDAMMAAALISLSRQWRRPLAAATTAAAFADSVLTASSVIRRPRARSWRDRVIIVAAVTAPLLLGAILLGGVITRRT